MLRSKFDFEGFRDDVLCEGVVFRRCCVVVIGREKRDLIGHGKLGRFILGQSGRPVGVKGVESFDG